jgi:hypothetical protein
VPANVLRPVPDLIRILRDEIFVPGGPLSPLAQGDPVALMQSDQAKIRIINNTYTAGLEQRTASFLSAQGMQVVEFGPPTGASNTHENNSLLFKVICLAVFDGTLWGGKSADHHPA